MIFNIITPSQEKNLKTLPIPIVRHIREGDNAYVIIERFARGARKAGWIKENIDLVLDEMKSDKYDHLLATALEFVRKSEDDDGNGVIDDNDSEMEYAEKPGCSGDDSAD